MPTTDDLLQVQGLRTSFRTPGGAVEAVAGVDLTLRAGQMLALIGESGSGKSVTARSIMGLLDSAGWIAGGSIRFQGRELLLPAADGMEHRHDAGMIMLPQELLPWWYPAGALGDQLRQALTGHGRTGQSATRQRLQGLCGRLGLPAPEQLLSASVQRISGSMQRRVLLALAVAQQPVLLLADEPTVGLEGTSPTQLVLALLKEVRATAGTAVLLISHDLGVVAELADEVAVLYAGRVVEQGTVRTVLGQPKHPYTVGLLQSTPTPGQRDPRLRVLPGPVIPALREPVGCPFAPRCAHVMALCREQDPPLKEAGGGSHARCWLY